MLELALWWFLLQAAPGEPPAPAPLSDLEAARLELAFLKQENARLRAELAGRDIADLVKQIYEERKISGEFELDFQTKTFRRLARPVDPDPLLTPKP